MGRITSYTCKPCIPNKLLFQSKWNSGSNSQKIITFQLWEATDFDHRLAPKKLINILSLSEKTLQLEDNEIEVEYQNETIGKYSLGFENGIFLLQNKKTDCLAKDNCGIPEQKPRIKIADAATSCCTPNSGCC